eukprot:TRINITY_DN6578_c0_g1_i1.p1 TRINITY_DN6578_c0_g1~~TRINITY_DN6578_c0_g1_i1.p1  ORF type:complete len:893 (+),score=224.14 TRINITY_DN6578_c0_g1_i1:30-2708(+)
MGNNKEDEIVDSEEEEEEEEEESEEEEEEEEEEEDEEPKLKYQRLGNNVQEILKHDQASCMSVHDKFLALGTRYGCVYMLDFNGNEIRRWQSHSANVNEMSIDQNGEYIGSCSDDGKVVINALYSNDMQEHTYNRPLLSIALDPDYFRHKSNQFCTGGKSGQISINSKGWFRAKDTVIHSGEGPIHTIKWRGPFIAWANDAGVKIYDCGTNQRITYINRPPGSPRPDLYRCNLCWENDHTLMIGWANSVKIGLIKERTDPGSGMGLPVHYVEIIAMFQTDYFISGLAPFGEYLAVLAYVEPSLDPDQETGDPKAHLPELRIITRTNEEISSDALPIQNFENYRGADYRLDHLASESLFYIVTPGDIVVAKPRDLDDHISWLMERKRYEEALSSAQQCVGQLQQHKLEDIGEKYIDHLLETGKVNEAAALCSKILKSDGKLWEKWIFRFHKIKQLKAISPYIPVGNPRLSDTVYEMVLNYFLHYDTEGFLKTITEWDHNLYNIQNVITAVRESLKRNPSNIVYDALAKLYTYDKQFDKTLEILLKLKRGRVFELIKKHNLFDAIQDKVLLLMEFDDSEEAVRLLVDNTDKIPIPQVVQQLQQKPRLLHTYLNAIFLKDAHLGAEFHELQVSLYAQYEKDMLLSFLKASVYYPLAAAYTVCEQKGLYEAMVYILGRMGNTKEALKLIIEKYPPDKHPVRTAIEFAEEVKDDELWDDLIEKCLQKPAFISELLEHIGAHVDPIELINKIPKGMEIIGLRDRLVKIISDYNLQMSLREGCKEILKADVVFLFERLYRSLKIGLKIDDQTKCASCSSAITSAKPDASVVVFFCNHVYHHRCLKSTNIPSDNTSATGNSLALTREISTMDERVWCTICANTQNKAGRLTTRVLGRKKM